MRKLKAIYRLIFAKRWMLYNDGRKDWNSEMRISDCADICEYMASAAAIGDEQQRAVNEVNKIINQK